MRWRRRTLAGSVVCRDLAMRHKRLVVRPTDGGKIALGLPSGEVLVFEPLQIGRLRGLLRDAVRDLDEPAAPERPR